MPVQSRTRANTNFIAESRFQRLSLTKNKVFFIAIYLSYSSAKSCPTKAFINRINCPIVILGAGVGGSHSTYRLSPTYKNQIYVYSIETIMLEDELMIVIIMEILPKHIILLQFQLKVLWRSSCCKTISRWIRNSIC